MWIGNRYAMPFFLCEAEPFSQWMQIFAQVISMDVAKPDDDDEEEWPRRPIFKAKKWAVRTMYELFNR